MDFIEFRNFALECNEEKSFFNILIPDARGKLIPIFSEGMFYTSEGRKLLFESCESAPDPFFKGKLENLFWLYRIKFKDARNRKEKAVAELVIYDGCVKIKVKKGSLRLKGIVKQGREKVEDLLAVSSTLRGSALRCSSGPAIPEGADMLYCRRTDSAVNFQGKAELSFDWKKKKYLLEAELDTKAPLEFRFERNFAQRQFHLKKWKGISYGHGFTTPPVGWMTWYAVRFAANEKIVLENAAAMKEIFGKYNDKMVIWVDWEWCHKTMSYHSEEGVDALHCRKEAYPNGLKFVSDKIKELGLIPALWTGATCEGNMNEYYQKHPDYVLADILNWPGRYWSDLSHPGVQNEYIPAVFRNILSWGYEAIKWDCLLNTMRYNDLHRARRHSPEMSVNESLHKVVAAGRKVIGGNFYLLGCTGMERATIEAMDIFDACRIGGDVFSWEDFKNNAVIPIFSYYPFHNTTIYLDPDTLVLRKEYSTYEQALSRISLFSLTGMQFTIGDAICDLDQKRIDALKCAMPAAVITPQEMCRREFSGETAQVSLSVNRPWGSWHVIGVFNLTDTPQECTLDMSGFPEGEYALFEFWSQKAQGIISKGHTLTLPPGGCAVFRLTPVEKTPFLTGSSRHLLQGVVELKEYLCDEEKMCISGKVQMVENEEMVLAFHIPENFAAVKDKNVRIKGSTAFLTIPGGAPGEREFQLNYKEIKK